jgi:hypothetical protein
MFESVEHEQGGTIAKRGQEGFTYGKVGINGDPQRIGDGRFDLVSFGQRSQINEGNAINKVGGHLPSDCQRKPRFPHTTRTCERDQAYRFAHQEGR